MLGTGHDIVIDIHNIDVYSMHISRNCMIMKC